MELPYFDPIALQLGPLAIRWYALAYIAGFLLGLQLIKHLWKRHAPEVLTQKAYEAMLSYAVLGVILGGRLGYVLFYDIGYYLQHPIEALYVWHGGMSFHGGMIGAAVGLWLLARKYALPYLKLMDVIAVAAPIGLFFGRIANFINGELVGRATESALGVVFYGDSIARHPSQLYEAATEGLLLFLLLYFLYRCTNLRAAGGRIAGCFLLGYGILRFLVEYVRAPDPQLGVLFDIVTMGQLLCIPMMLAGLYLIYRHSHA